MVAEWPPFGKELLILLTISSLCIMSICNLNHFPFLFRGQDFGSDLIPRHCLFFKPFYIVQNNWGLQGYKLFFLFLACCQGSKPVLESFSDIQCVFLEDSRRHCIFL